MDLDEMLSLQAVRMRLERLAAKAARKRDVSECKRLEKERDQVQKHIEKLDRAGTS